MLVILGLSLMHALKVTRHGTVQHSVTRCVAFKRAIPFPAIN